MQILARAVGRRKEAVAQVQILTGTGKFIINKTPAEEYLQNNTCSLLSVKEPFNVLNTYNELIKLNKTKLDLSTEPAIDKFDGGLKKEDYSNSSKDDSPFNEETFNTSSNNSSLKGEAQLNSSSNTNTAFLEGQESLLNSSLKTTDFITGKFDTIVTVRGGGLIGQAEAIKLGLARVICQLTEFSILDKKNNIELKSKNLTDIKETQQKNPSILDDFKPEEHFGEKNSQTESLRKLLKTKGYLTQDSRVKERRKYGLKKARKASQYHKR